MSELCPHGVNPGFCLECMDDPDGLRKENRDLKNQLSRCLIALDQVNRIAGDMLDGTRRRGPRGGEVRGCNSMEPSNAEEREARGRGVGGSLQEEVSGGRIGSDDAQGET